jgi:hypothetical protein
MSRKQMNKNEAKKYRWERWLSSERFDFTKKITMDSVVNALQELLVVPWYLILTGKSRTALKKYSKNPLKSSFIRNYQNIISDSFHRDESFFGPKIIVGALLVEFQKDTLTNFKAVTKIYSKQGPHIWNPVQPPSGMQKNYIPWPPMKKQVLKYFVTPRMKKFVKKDINHVIFIQLGLDPFLTRKLEDYVL